MNVVHVRDSSVSDLLWSIYFIEKNFGMEVQKPSVESPVEKKLSSVKNIGTISESTLRIIDKIFVDIQKREEIPMETWKKIHALLGKVLEKWSNITFPQKRSINHALRSIEAMSIDREFSFFMKCFREKQLQNISAEELKLLNLILKVAYNSLRSFRAIIAYDIFDCAKISLIEQFEKQGGFFKPPEKLPACCTNGSLLELDWEKIPEQTAEGVSLSAYFAQALAERQLTDEVISLTKKLKELSMGQNDVKNRGFSDSSGYLGIHATLDIWHTYEVARYLGSIQQIVRNERDMCTDGSLEVDKAIVEISTSSERKKVAPLKHQFVQHCKSQDSFNDYSNLLRAIIENYEKERFLARKYVDATKEIIGSYKEIFELYCKAVPSYKDCEDSLPPTPEEFYRISIPLPDPQIVLQKISWEDVFGELVALPEAQFSSLSVQERDKKIVQTILQKVAPDDTLFADFIVERCPFQSAPQCTEKCPDSEAAQAASASPSKKHKKKKRSVVAKKAKHSFKKKPTEEEDVRVIEKGLKALKIEEQSCTDRVSSCSCVNPCQSTGVETEKEKSDPVVMSPETKEETFSEEKPAHFDSEKAASISDDGPRLEEVTREQAKKSKHLKLCVQAAKPPIVASLPIDRVSFSIDRRVRSWKLLSKKDCKMQSEKDSIDFHTYPFLITELIMRYVSSKPWVSPSTNKVNHHYSCVGTIERFGERLPKVRGYFAECVDEKKFLYHHFFHPCSQSKLIGQFKQEGTFFSSRDIQCIAELAAADKTTVKIKSNRYQIEEGQIVTKVRDLKKKVEYVLILFDKLLSA